ncbi:MAG: DUF177 domain-containing protein [Coriobacteriia bacterium]|nr:DUF177 domain-containing protein [Coriobacteriia bacterium]
MDTPSYLADVRFILEDLGGSLALDSEVELPVIVIGAETFTPLKPARLVADVTNTGSGIVVSGTVDAEVQAVCSRCLREFPLQVTGAVEGFYISRGDDYEIPEEQEFGYIVDGSIDLMEQILAALTLELPFAPVHDENCPGICPRCGADLVDGPCDCKPDHSDSPFAALKDLLPDDAES